MKASDLEKHLASLTQEQERRRSVIFDTSDQTRDVAGSIQQGMYWGQLALGMFRNLTNYHLPPKKRIQKVLVTAGVLILANFLRKKLARK